MTRGRAVAGDPATGDDPVRRWCADAAAILEDAAVRAGHLSAAVATDWLDDDGREWAERVAALRRDLADSAHQADELVRRLREPDDADAELASAMAAALRAVSAAAHAHSGPQLGDTSGARVDDEHGVRIAQLPDPAL